jgi:hypothetical protein
MEAPYTKDKFDDGLRWLKNRISSTNTADRLDSEKASVYS